MNSHYLYPNWPAPAQVNAVTTLRFDGHSSSPYASFNLSTRESEDYANVMANRQQLQQELALPSAPLWLDQVHGIRAIQAETFDETLPAADASYSKTVGTVCAILTADCLPLLLCNTAGTEVAAIHAGWRGLLAGVIENTVAQLSTAQHWLAWLGPAIGPRVFEVGNEVREQFIAALPAAAQAFAPLPENKWLADIYKLAQQRLANCGITQIYGGDLCTYSDAKHFYSFRRDAGKTGRMASLIWLTAEKSK